MNGWKLYLSSEKIKSAHIQKWKSINRALNGSNGKNGKNVKQREQKFGDCSVEIYFYTLLCCVFYLVKILTVFQKIREIKGNISALVPWNIEK